MRTNTHFSSALFLRKNDVVVVVDATADADAGGFFSDPGDSTAAPPAPPVAVLPEYRCSIDGGGGSSMAAAELGVGSADRGIVVVVALGAPTDADGGMHDDGVLGVMVVVEAAATTSPLWVLLLLLLLLPLLLTCAPMGTV